VSGTVLSEALRPRLGSTACAVGDSRVRFGPQKSRGKRRPCHHPFAGDTTQCPAIERSSPCRTVRRTQRFFFHDEQNPTFPQRRSPVQKPRYREVSDGSANSLAVLVWMARFVPGSHQVPEPPGPEPCYCTNTTPTVSSMRWPFPATSANITSVSWLALPNA